MLDERPAVTKRCRTSSSLKTMRHSLRSSPAINGQPRDSIPRCHGEVLLVSAIDTLSSTSPGIIDAMTLSVAVESDDEAAALQRLALGLAEEYEIHADITVRHDHLIVRLTRQDCRGIQPIA